MTAFFGAGACAARASMGSVTIRNADAAEAAAERCKNDRRENGRREFSEPIVKPHARGNQLLTGVVILPRLANYSQSLGENWDGPLLVRWKASTAGDAKPLAALANQGVREAYS